MFFREDLSKKRKYEPPGKKNIAEKREQAQGH